CDRSSFFKLCQSFMKTIKERDCILPCSFQAGQSLIIHWYHMTPTQTGVHSYYENKDQWGHQQKRFRGRTSLFQDQFSKGNASLQLTGVMVQDEGSYQCHTSTITNTRDLYINMKVYGTRNKPRKLDSNVEGNEERFQAELQISESVD
uniref:Ig-like domain-containing protein n=1 Tax=Oryzias sinensis TaxID=183150 RepID=A0A8C7X497_9TELE